MNKFIIHLNTNWFLVSTSIKKGKKSSRSQEDNCEI